MSVNVSNKKYSILYKPQLQTEAFETTVNGTFYPSEGKVYNLVRVKVPEPDLQSIEIEPFVDTENHRIIPEDYNCDAFNEIIVKPVTHEIDENIKPEFILKNITILGVTGTVHFETEDLTIEPKTIAQPFTPTKDGFYNISVKPVTNEIDENIRKSNIKKGITILGVEGSLVEINTVSRDIDENGTFKPNSPYNGFSEVKVKVKSKALENIQPTTTSYEAPELTGDDAIYSGYYPVTVAPVTASIDENIKPENIKSGVTILSVEGELEPLKSTEKTITENGEYYPTDDGNFNGYSKVTVNINTVNNTDIEITPTTSEQIKTPDEPYTGYGTVTVKAVDRYIDNNIQPQHILKDIEILGVVGTVTEVSLQPEKTVAPATTDITVAPEGSYNGLSKVIVKGVTSSIDPYILAENIKKDVTILNVSGTCVELKGETRTETLTNKNGATYTPNSGKNGITSITVTPNNQPISITPNQFLQEFDVENGYSGYGKVTVYPAPVQAKTLTVDASTSTVVTIEPDDNYYALSSVEVDLTWVENQLKSLNAGDTPTTVVLQDKTFTAAGSYTCDDGYDGFGTVTIDLDWVEDAIEQARTEACDGTADRLIGNTAISLATDSDYIRKYAFAYNTSLLKVVLNNATNIDQYAFINSGVTTLIINTQTVCALSSTNVFTTAPNIYVPDALLNSYKTAANWSSFASNIFAQSTL